MCLTIRRNNIYEDIYRFIICDLYKCADKNLFVCETFESLGKAYVRIISKTIKGSRRKMIFKLVDLHAQRHGKTLNNKNDKYVYLCKEIIGIKHLPKDTYGIVLTKYNELFKEKYVELKRKIEIACKEIEQPQNNIKASISKIGSKKNGILEDISIDEKRLLQYHRENNRLRTKEDVLLEIKNDLEEKFKTYCDIESKADVARKNRDIAIQYSTGVFQIENIDDVFLPYEAHLEACENYLICYDKKSADIKIYPFFELARKQLLSNHRSNNESYQEEFEEKIEELTLWRDNLYIAMQESKDIEKTSEFIAQKNILNEMENYIDSLICLGNRKNLLKDLLDLYKSERFDLFINLCPIQIEGIFNDLQYDVELLHRFQNLTLDPTQDLKHKINSIEDSIPYEYVLYFGHCFNNLQRNIVAHGRWLLDQNSIKVANELLLDLHSLLYMVSRYSHLERMYRFINKYVDNNSRITGNCYGALYYDLTGERIHGDYDYIGHIEPKQVLLWIFNPFYESMYKKVAEEDDASLEQIRNVLSSTALWEYIDEDIDKKIRGEMINNYLNSFKFVLVELIKCNISDEAKSKINEIKIKLFKYEKQLDSI